LQTGLPASTYCDVISGDKVNGNCSGLRITINSDGTTYFSIGNLLKTLYCNSCWFRIVKYKLNPYRKSYNHTFVFLFVVILIIH
jgi:hypothetical protein